MHLGLYIPALPRHVLDRAAEVQWSLTTVTSPKHPTKCLDHGGTQNFLPYYGAEVAFPPDEVDLQRGLIHSAAFDITRFSNALSSTTAIPSGSSLTLLPLSILVAIAGALIWQSCPTDWSNKQHLLAFVEEDAGS